MNHGYLRKRRRRGWKSQASLFLNCLMLMLMCNMFPSFVSYSFTMDTESDVYFSIDFWYHIFRDNTVRTCFIPVSSDFVDYMLAGW